MKIKNIIYWFNREKTILLTSLICGFFITGIILHSTKEYSEKIQTGLAANVIRFHVIANSDSKEDQQIKEEVRDAILKEMTPLLADSDSIEKTRQIIINNSDKIKTIAEETINKSGKSYPVEVSLGPDIFPTKQYGDIVFPTGEYEALKVSIGKATWKNWWCVMFPPLCFVDVTHGVVPEESKEDLRKVLSEEEYKIVTQVNYDEDIPVKIKFKIVKWWQEWKLSKKHHFVKKRL
ncbi:MAG TPA: stage II sporulation protein R [Defluviitaleaceae bacterium]|nr:stage II sporulation protein R [Defluviitaleaceae bacterium]